MVRARATAFLFSLFCVMGFVTAGSSVSAPPESMGRPGQRIRITSDDIGRLPAGRNYFVDLTRRGVIYDFDSTARPIDFTRVTVRTAKGDVVMETWLKGQFPRIAASRWKAGYLRIGDAKEFRSLSARGPRISAPRFTCDGNQCDCHGDDDCNDMFGSGVCGQVAVCTPEGCSCLSFP